MASTTDANGNARRVKRARENLGTADIDERDRTAIREFTDHREINDNVELATLRDDIANLRRCAERSPVPLVEFSSIKDVNAVLKRNTQDFGVGKGSNDNYRKVMRVFFCWLTDDPDYAEYEFWDDIAIPSRSPDPVDPSEILSESEVDQLRQSADHPREKAIIEFLADTGMRITAALQIPRGNVDGLETPHPTFSANRNGEGQKGIDPLPRPIIQSARQLRVYLNEYHPEDHDDAPLFATKQYDRRDREDCAVAPVTVRNKLKGLAERVGIDRDRVTNHGFRHVAVTRMRRDMDMDWDDIAHRTGWSENSISRMKQIYAHLSNEDKNDRIWDAVGRGSTENGDGGTPVFATCINCAREIDAEAQFCPDCGADQDADPIKAKLGQALAGLDRGTAQDLLDAVKVVDDG